MRIYSDRIFGQNIFRPFPRHETEKIIRMFETLPFSSYAMLEMEAVGPQKIDFSANIKKLAHDDHYGSQNPLIAHILEQWKTDEVLAHYLADMWVEYDSHPDGYRESTFLTLRNFDHTAPEKDLETIDTRTGLNLPAAHKEKIRATLKNIPAANTVSHLGFMVSRGHAPVRINIKKSEKNLPEVLAALDIHLPETETIAPLLRLADTVTLAIDVDETGITPRVGFECFFNAQNREYPPQALFLDALVAAGLCAETTRDQTLEWIGIDPLEGENDALPIDGIVSKIQFSYLWRIVNHVKIVVENGKVIAKLYLAFGHKWTN